MQDRVQRLENELKEKNNELKNAARRGILLGEIENLKYKLILTNKTENQLTLENMNLQSELKDIDNSSGFCGTFVIAHKRDLMNKISNIEEEINFRKDLQSVHPHQKSPS